MVAPLRRISSGEISHLVSSHVWTWKIVVVAMLRNTEISSIVISTQPLTYSWSLVVWTRLKSHLWIQKIIWKYQEMGWLTLWVSRAIYGERKRKSQGMPSLMSVWSIFQILSRSFKNYLKRVMCWIVPNMNPLTVTFT